MFQVQGRNKHEHFKHSVTKKIIIQHWKSNILLLNNIFQNVSSNNKYAHKKWIKNFYIRAKLSLHLKRHFKHHKNGKFNFTIRKSCWLNEELQKKHFIAKMGTLKNLTIFGVSKAIICIQLKTTGISLEHNLYLIKIKVFRGWIVSMRANNNLHNIIDSVKLQVFDARQ